MGPLRRWLSPKALAIVWLVALTAISVYRGVTHVLTVDEAYNFNLFIANPEALFRQYDACYHVLHTWLTFLSTQVLGPTEWALRVPSMLAGCFLLAGVYRISRYLFGGGWSSLVAILVLSSNPLILDHMSLARGYGLALALTVWACYHAIRWMAVPGETQRLGWISVLMGLTVASNLTFIVPAFALGLMIVAAPMIGVDVRIPTRQWLGWIFERLWIPGIVIAFMMLVIPVANAAGSNFYFGATDLGTFFTTLIHPSLAHGEPLRPEWVKWIEYSLFPILAVALAFVMVRALRDRGPRNARVYAAILSTGALVLSLTALIAMRVVLGVPYPWARTGLYLVWFFLLSLVTAWSWTEWKALAVVCVAFAAAFINQLEYRYYWEFREDADVRTLLREMRALRGDDRSRVRMAGNDEFVTIVDYYRSRWKADWISPLDRAWRDRPADYYLLLPRDVQSSPFRLEILSTGKISGAVLARRATGS